MKFPFLRTLIQCIFPSRCVVCGREPTRLHSICAQKLCPAPPPTHLWIISLYSYKDPRTSTLIRHLKNKEDAELCETLGKLLAHCWLQHSPEAHTTILVAPVPARAERMRTNGFNQAELLAKHLAHHISGSLLVTNLVQRTRETTKQALIHEKLERLHNLKNVFALHSKKKDLVRNALIIIVDDVTTSGATLTEIKNVLEQSGAHSVYALTLAH